MPVNISSLPPGERKVLFLVYQYAPASVQDIQSQLSDTTYGAVRRLLDSLAKKGLVTHEKEGRAYRYCTVHSRAEQGAKLLEEAIRVFFDDSAALGFASLISKRRSKELQDLEMENAKQLLQQLRKGALEKDQD